MYIGLIDADLIDNGTRHPNLALMKIAGYYKDMGHTVELIYDGYSSVINRQYDKVFISCVFTYTKVPKWILELDNVSYGGTGFFEDGGEDLPDEIEHHMPYYDIYKPYIDEQLKNGRKRTYFQDYLDYSIGFTTRGCFRKCEFCVNKKYNHAFRHSPVREFLDDKRPFIYLWDDNFLAYPQWEEILDEIEETGKQFQFRQGLDIRLMTDRKAERLAHTKYQGDFIFAFDYIEDTPIIEEKIQLWKRHSNKVIKLYILVAYKSQDIKDIEDAFQRIHTLMKLGSIPYVMRFEDYKTSPFRSLYVELARWCNQPNFFKKMSFRQFCIANQEYKKNQNTNCSAYQSMLDFENEYPEIADKYFDLHFEEENYYTRQYGYGRRYANKPSCQTCIRSHLCWSAFMDEDCDKDAFLIAYLTKQIDFECLRYKNPLCGIKASDVIYKMVELLLASTDEHIIALLKDCKEKEMVTQDNIPQISRLKDAVFNVTKNTYLAGEMISYDKLGYYLTRQDKKFRQNPGANKKYGENHAKLAAQMDLVVIDKGVSRQLVELSEFGKIYYTFEEEKQNEVARKLRYRIPIVQKYFVGGENQDIVDDELKILSKTTQNRRRSSVINVIQWNLEE